MKAFMRAIVGLVLVLGISCSSASGQAVDRVIDKSFDFSQVKTLTLPSFRYTGDLDWIHFPYDDMLILGDVGTTKGSVRLRAYSSETGDSLWTCKVSKEYEREFVLDQNVWFDPQQKLMLTASGSELTATGAEDGRKIWETKIGGTDFLYDVDFGANRILSYGAKNDLGKEKIACMDKSTGAKLWEIEAKPPSYFPLPLAFALEDANANNEVYEQLDSGRIVLFSQDKVIFIDSATGNIVVAFEDIKDMPVFSNNRMYMSQKGIVKCLALPDAKEIWKSSGSMSKNIELYLASDDRLLAVYQGSYDSDEERWSGDFQMTIISTEDGSFVGPQRTEKDLPEMSYHYGHKIQDSLLVFKYWHKGFLSGEKSYTLCVDLRTGRDAACPLENASGSSASAKAPDGDWKINGKIIDIGYESIECYDESTGKKAYGIKLSRSAIEHGFFKRALVGAFNTYATMANATSGLSVGKPSGAGPQTSYIELSEGSGAVGIVGNDIVWPTSEQGVLGINIDNGSIAWRIATAKNPMPAFSEKGNICIIRDKETVYLLKATH